MPFNYGVKDICKNSIWRRGRSKIKAPSSATCWDRVGSKDCHKPWWWWLNPTPTPFMGGPNPTPTPTKDIIILFIHSNWQHSKIFQNYVKRRRRRKNKKIYSSTMSKRLLCQWHQGTLVSQTFILPIGNYCLFVYMYF